MHPNRPALILTIILIMISTSVFSQSGFEIGAGFAPWHESHVLNANSKRIPIQPYVEYGKILDHYSVTLFYDFFSKYKLDNYTMNPTFFGVFLNRNIYTAETYNYDFELGVSGGLLVERHKFLDRGNSNVPGYTLETEIKSGVGFGARAYAKFVFGNFVVTPQAQFFRSQQDFVAGQFNEQTFQTGSTRLLLSIGYKFNSENYGKVTCPTYY